MKRLLALAVALWPALGAAQVSFRMPVSDCGSCAHAPLYPTAYMDLDANAGSIKDWSCGTLTYDGHKGTDIAIGGWANMDQGSMEVVAAADGDVIYTHDGENDRCGDGVNGMCGNQPCTGPSGHCGNGDSNSVAIRHADGKVSTYLHMMTGTVRVAVGDHVTCGQVLGLVGSSGWSTGPHCHFEVDLGGAYLSNPDDPFASTCGAGGTLTYWVDQGAYQDLPGSVCQNATTTTTSTTSSSSGSSSTSGTTSGSSSSGTTTSGTTSGTSTSGSTTSGTTTGGTTTSGSSTTTGGSTGGTDLATFVNETIPDGTKFAPTAQIVKAWVLLNAGTARWDAAGGYKLVLVQPDPNLTTPTELDFGASEHTDPGRDKSWALPITLPNASATYNQTWQMQHNGTAFGPTLTLQIVVAPGTDADGDGHVAMSEGGDDCDDNDASVFPGNPEICDGKDNDCNGKVDDNITHSCTTLCGSTGVQTCSVDANGNPALTRCQASEGSPEICDGLDNDCNGIVDDGAICGVGSSCRNGQCTPDSATGGTSGTTGGATSTGATGGTSGSTGSTAGDTAAQPAGCGCTSGVDGGLALLGVLAFARRRRKVR